MNNLNNGTAKSKAYSLNTINLKGRIISEVTFSHEIMRKDEADNGTISFYRFTLEVKRFSGTSDFLEVIVPEEAWFEFANNPEYKNAENRRKVVVEISGRLQSHNSFDTEMSKNRLDLYVYAKYINSSVKSAKDNNVDTELDKSESTNAVSLEGFVCKKPVIRQTHSGRTIADLFIAVNRRGNSSYIPVILWGGNAVNAKKFKVGDKLRLSGRFQSREFAKGVNGTLITCMAYEVSASKVNLLDDVSLAHC